MVEINPEKLYEEIINIYDSLSSQGKAIDKIIASNEYVDMACFFGSNNHINSMFFIAKVPDTIDNSKYGEFLSKYGEESDINISLIDPEGNHNFGSIRRGQLTHDPEDRHYDVMITEEFYQNSENMTLIEQTYKDLNISEAEGTFSNYTRTTYDSPDLPAFAEKFAELRHHSRLKTMFETKNDTYWIKASNDSIKLKIKYDVTKDEFEGVVDAALLAGFDFSGKWEFSNY